ncbi:hypothetical protein [Jiangella alba]|uniref:Uncharacterized protein n=1 Tax=Jiangella alba TaxID=561176 RepID=A0A1H5PX40_9ACTN|nr:hypothetical protein [Jiangella alba]SEF18366.1 hypothetical protein SAMN04488561_6426 [Jiangella alba]
MPTRNQEAVRKTVLDALMRKVEADRYPSPTMLDHIEALLTDDDVAEYAALLAERVEEDLYPSIPMLRRLLRLAA